MLTPSKRKASERSPSGLAGEVRFLAALAAVKLVAQETGQPVPKEAVRALYKAAVASFGHTEEEALGSLHS